MSALRLGIAVVALVICHACRLPLETKGLRPLVPQATVPASYVESLRPEFSWQAFPNTNDERALDAAVLQRMSDVRYDLRIRSTVFPLEVVYAREGLPEPRHPLESDLAPLAQYTWEVRARFRLGDEERVTPWGSTPRGWRSAVLPAPAAWQFRTPANPAASAKAFER